MVVGPIARFFIQLVLPIAAVAARALPAAWAQALQNARKAGIDATNPNVQNMLRKKLMDKSEALQILNLTEAEATPEAIKKQYEKFMASNDVQNGGSFYLQSKIYRAQEMLLEFERDKKEDEEKQQ